MAPNFPHSIFDPLSCTGTQWMVDKVMTEHFLHSVLICDIHTSRFPLDCSRAAVCPCTLFRVCCRPHSEGCEGSNLTTVKSKKPLFSGTPNALIKIMVIIKVCYFGKKYAIMVKVKLCKSMSRYAANRKSIQKFENIIQLYANYVKVCLRCSTFFKIMLRYSKVYQSLTSFRKYIC